MSFVAAGIGVASSCLPGCRASGSPGVLYLPLLGTHPSIDLGVAYRRSAGVIAQTHARLHALVSTG